MAARFDYYLGIGCVLLCVFSISTVQANAVGWDYSIGKGKGPDEWKNEYPNCGGVMQSPINIQDEQVIYDRNLKYFDMKDYSITEGVEMSLHNEGGHTAEVVYKGAEILLRGGSLPAVYQLNQFHFHWGKVDGRGSEHARNGKHHSMEMHLVHHQKHLGNISVAQSQPFGLAVIAFFIEVGDHNSNFDKLLSNFDNITQPDDHVEIETLKLADLLPATVGVNYYRYQGSLTTPPCYQSVIWSVATDPIKLSEDQINKFRSLYEAKDEHLVDDFRPLQLINERIITTNSNKFDSSHASNSIPSHLILIGAHLLFVYVAGFYPEL